MFTEDDYYDWLLNMIDVLHGDYSNYKLLMKYMYTHEFRYVLSMDANRAKGGLSLRSLYAMEAGLYLEDVKEGPCSILEMLIGLANNMYMYTDIPTFKWFWEMMENLGLMFFDDDNYDENYISERLDCWMDREFDKSGQGSIFPLGEDFSGDARTIEIWNQMNKYLTINYPIGDWL